MLHLMPLTSIYLNLTLFYYSLKYSIYYYYYYLYLKYVIFILSLIRSHGFYYSHFYYISYQLFINNFLYIKKIL